MNGHHIKLFGQSLKIALMHAPPPTAYAYATTPLIQFGVNTMGTPTHSGDKPPEKPHHLSWGVQGASIHSRPLWPSSAPPGAPGGPGPGPGPEPYLHSHPEIQGSIPLPSTHQATELPRPPSSSFMTGEGAGVSRSRSLECLDQFFQGMVGVEGEDFVDFLLQ